MGNLIRDVKTNRDFLFFFFEMFALLFFRSTEMLSL